MKGIDSAGGIIMACTVLHKLIDDNIAMPAVCGGAGICGKCKFYIDGMLCLACQTEYTPGMKIDLISKIREDFSILTGISDRINIDDEVSFNFAVDVGTTTIAFALTGGKSGKTVFNYGIVNSQRKYGADVISRIKASNEGNLNDLNHCVTRDIDEGIKYILEQCGISAAKINKVAISGNTAMLHILLKVDCRSLGQYPFDPVFIDKQERTYNEIFYSNILSCEVVLLPGISTYVGSDVVAGISYGIDLGSEGLLIDLGTNGEIALFSKHGVIGTATAAGPAFEAGNISCGVGSIPGAIYEAKYKNKSFEYKTIGDCTPIGICGSGVIDITAQLVLNGYIDETGVMQEDFEVAENIFFTKKDVRELQLAKSAVRAGIEVLLSESGKTYNDIGNIYLAGGFGHRLNPKSAIILGILPEEWRKKVKAIGNSSLAGCIKYLYDESDFDFIKNAREINLSVHPDFNDLFMEYMMF